MIVVFDSIAIDNLGQHESSNLPGYTFLESLSLLFLSLLVWVANSHWSPTLLSSSSTYMPFADSCNVYLKTEIHWFLYVAILYTTKTELSNELQLGLHYSAVSPMMMTQVLIPTNIDERARPLFGRKGFKKNKSEKCRASKRRVGTLQRVFGKYGFQNAETIHGRKN